MKKYEDLISELKEIISRMEDNETTLEESINLYEKGTVLIKLCEKRLMEAEVRISQLSGEGDTAYHDTGTV